MKHKLFSALLALTLLCGAFAMPAGATEAGEHLLKNQFPDGDFCYETLKDGTVAVIRYLRKDDPTQTDIVLPEKAAGKTVTALVQAFDHAPHIRSVVIPDSVKRIVDDFSACENLRTVSLPRRLEEIDGFSDCPRLKPLRLPKTVRSIGWSFLLDSKNAKVTISSKNPYFTKKGPAIFTKDRKTLVWFQANDPNKVYTVPKTVTTIGAHAFALRTLKRIVLPDGTRKIMESAFQDCPAKINLPASVERIQTFAFSGSGIRTVVLRKKIKHLAGNAFYACPKLRSVEVQAGVKNTSDLRAHREISIEFNACPKLKTIRVAKTAVITECSFGCRDDDIGGLFKGVTVYGYKGSPADRAIRQENHGNKVKLSFVPLVSLKNAVVKGVVDKAYTKAVKQSGAKQRVKVSLKGKALKKGRDYTVTYKHNKARGKATVIVTGINRYDGTLKRTFKIR